MLLPGTPRGFDAPGASHLPQYRNECLFPFRPSSVWRLCRFRHRTAPTDPLFALPPTPFDRGREEGGRRARGPPSAQLLSQREALALGLRTDSPLDQ